MAELTLYPYQEDGVRFLLRRPPELNGKPHRLLADEQGLGKTAQAISAMVRLKARTCLIVCPASVKYNWARNLILWGLADEHQIYVVKTQEDQIPSSANYVIINYALAVSRDLHYQLTQRKYDVGILDECHRLKNLKAKRSKLILGSKLGVTKQCFYKFLLSGTPVPNRPIEFYIVLRTLAPELIEPHLRYAAFGKQFCSGYESKFGDFDPESGKRWNFQGASNIEDLNKRLQPFMLRRELSQVYTQLPPMVEEIVRVECDVLSHPEVLEQFQDQKIARTEAFDPETEMPMATFRRIIGEAKLPAVIEYLVDKMDTVDKLVVFAYHQSVIRNLQEALLSRRINCDVIQGGVSAVKKDSKVQDFIDALHPQVLIMQHIAGGEAIDGLQKVCNHVVFAELDWSEGGMRQAKSRLHRIGQTKTVFVTHLLSEIPLEQIMAAVLERKSSVINRLMKGHHSMSIEQHLERIADALEKIVEGTNFTEAAAENTEAKASAGKSGKGSKGGKKADTKKEPKGPTLTDLKDAAKNFVENLGGTKAQAKALIKEHGADSLGNLDESKYKSLLDAFNAGPQADDEDDDDEDL